MCVLYIVMPESEQRSVDKHWTARTYLLVLSIICYILDLICEITCILHGYDMQQIRVN